MSEVIRPAAEIDRAIESLLCRGAEVHLLNTSIIPPGADGLWRVAEVDISYVVHILSWLGHSGAYGFLHSHVGHESTAAIASELLRQKVDVDRRPWNGEGIGVAIQMNGRPPEGKILSREEVEEIGYKLRLVYCEGSDLAAAITADRERTSSELRRLRFVRGDDPYPTLLDAVKDLVNVVAPFLDLHSRGAQGEHDRLYEQFEGFRARLYLMPKDDGAGQEASAINPSHSIRRPAPVTDYDWAELQRQMMKNVGRFFAAKGTRYEDIMRRLGPVDRGTFELEVKGTETGFEGIRFRYVDRLKKDAEATASVPIA